MGRRVRQLLIKEFLQAFRDPRMRGVLLLAPLIQLLVFGYAVTTDVRDIPTVIVDRDRTPESRELISRFLRSGYFRPLSGAASVGEAERWIESGAAQAILVLNRGFSGEVGAGRGAQVQLLVDGSDSNTAGVILHYASRIVREHAKKVMLEQWIRLQGAFRPLPALNLETRAWFNENLESRNFYVPGVIAVIVTLITLMLTSMAIVREREIGTMEQILVSPLSPGEFMLGKMIPFGLIGLVDVLLVTGVGVLWFAIPVRGNLILLFFCTCLYLMTTLGIGLFISTISHTQQQAMMTTFFFFMPALLLSGLMFPIANMPKLVQAVTLLNPMRYFLVIVRGIFLKGVGVAIIWPQMAALLAMGLLVLGLATRRFRKTLA